MTRAPVLMLVLILALGGSVTGPASARASATCLDDYGSDYNGDGAADLAVADPYATVGGADQAGDVVVLYGSKGGRFGAGGSAVLSQDSAGVPGAAEAGDSFGTTLSSADLDCDGFTDLVVGVPYEDAGGKRNVGVVDVLYGAAGGLGTGRPARVLDHATFRVKPQAGDRFGASLATKQQASASVTTPADQHDAIAVGVPGRDVKGATDAGAVGYVHPLGGKLRSDWVVEGADNVEGVPQPGDRFGAAVALGYLIDGLDLVVGAPGEDIGKATDAGQVTIVFNNPFSGATFSDTLAQVPHGEVGGLAETGDAFGSSVDVASAHEDDPDNSRNYFAIGIPGEDLGDVTDAGAVAFGVAFDFDGIAGAQTVTQRTAGVAGAAEAGDRFGEHVMLSRDGRADLLLGLPHEDGSQVDSGAVQNIPVRDSTFAGPTFTQNSPGVPGVSQAGDHFGEAFTQIRDAHSSAYVIGVPDDASQTSGMVEVVPKDGRPYALIPGVAGVPGEGASRFGAVLPSSGREFVEADLTSAGAHR